MIEYRLKLGELLEKKDFTVQSLAKEIGVQPRTVQRWINGGSPELLNFYKLVYILDCKVDDLLEITDVDKKAKATEE